MINADRKNLIIQDLLVNHLPRIVESLETGYVDETQALVLFDHMVRARILTEQPRCDGCGKPANHTIMDSDGGQQKGIEYYCEKCDGGGEGVRRELPIVKR